MLVNKFLIRLLIKLRNGEHAEFGTSIVKHIKAAIITIPQLLEGWNRYEALVHLEDLLFKTSSESPESQLIAADDKERDRLFREVRHELRFYSNDSEMGVKNAAKSLLFVLKPYEHAPTGNLFEETKYIENFLVDINKPENDAHKAALPNIAAILQKLETVNERLEGLYQQRLQTLHDLEQLGKSADIRKDVDKRLIEFIDDMNAIHRSNELGDKDAALKTKLESSASYIEALVEQTERVLSRRDHHHKSSNETPAETEPSNPPANPPEQKPEDPQAPNTTLPQAPDMPPQQPSATPPPINPEDLNPPAAGE